MLELWILFGAVIYVFILLIVLDYYTTDYELGSFGMHDISIPLTPKNARKALFWPFVFLVAAVVCIYELFISFIKESFIFLKLVFSKEVDYDR